MWREEMENQGAECQRLFIWQSMEYIAVLP